MTTTQASGKKVPTQAELDALPAFGPQYEAEYQKLPPGWQDYVYHFSTVMDAKHYLHKELRNSILLATFAGYAKQMMNFAQWAVNNEHAAPPRESEEERNLVGSYADWYVKDCSKAYSSIADLVSGIRKRCRSQDHWCEGRWWKDTKRGLEREERQPQWRFPWPRANATGLIDFAIDEAKDRDSALAFLIAFYGLARSGHFDTIIVGDVQETERLSWMKGVFPEEAATYNIYIVAIKCRKRLYEGEYIKVPDHRDLIKDAISGKGRFDPLVPTWNSSRSIKLMNEYAKQCGLSYLGYKMDMHSLRCGGTAHLQWNGVHPDIIRTQAKWAPDSAMLLHYGAALPPLAREIAEMCVAERARLKEGTLNGPSRRTVKSNIKLQERIEHCRSNSSNAFIAEEAEEEDSADEERDGFLSPGAVETGSPEEMEEAATTRLLERIDARAILPVCAACGQRIYAQPERCKKCKRQIHRMCKTAACACKDHQPDAANRAQRAAERQRAKDGVATEAGEPRAPPEVAEQGEAPDRKRKKEEAPPPREAAPTNEDVGAPREETARKVETEETKGASKETSAWVEAHLKDLEARRRLSALLKTGEN